MTDEKTQQLENRINSLEATIEKMMPSRRDALKMGGAALVGGAAMSGTASAGTNQVGTIGSASQPVDLESEDINNADTVTTQDLVVNGTATGVAQDLQGCRVFLSSNQNISTTQRVLVEFDGVVYDSGSNFDTTNHSFTCPENGLYVANLQIRRSAGGNPNPIELYIGSSTNHALSSEGAFVQTANSEGGDSLQATTINKYSAGDTIAAHFQNKSGSDSLDSGPQNFRSFLEVAFLGNL